VNSQQYLSVKGAGTGGCPDVAPAPGGSPQHVQAEVIAASAIGPYRRLSFLAPGIARTSVAGQFLSLRTGGGIGSPLRRCFAILDADPPAGTVSIAFSALGMGTRWLAQRKINDVLNVVGPLGVGFSLPDSPAKLLFVAGGHGGAGVFRAVREAAQSGHKVHVVSVAATEVQLFMPHEMEYLSDSVFAVVEPVRSGSLRPLAEHLASEIRLRQPDVIYGCGSMPLLESLAKEASKAGILALVATETAMACGFGVCMTCVLPIRGADGVTRMIRSCCEGPVFRGDSVQWHEIGRPLEEPRMPASCLPTQEGRLTCL
jgi:dihydroorotate dehydrogenase electron transfer subunit